MPPRPKHILVIVPGLAGSKLRQPNGLKLPIWGDFHISVPLLGPTGIVDAMDFSNPLEPYDLMNEIAPFLPFPGNQHYRRLIEFLTDDLGYVPGPTNNPAEFPFFTFPYDWRQDNRISARQLRDKIATWRTGAFSNAEVYILAHSQGGVVSRWYIEKEGGDKVVTKLFLFGSPWDGTTKAFSVLEEGPDEILLKLFFLFRAQIARVMRTFPSMYQLLPHRAKTLVFNDGSSDTLFTRRTWVHTPTERALLEDAEQFNKALPETSSVPVVRYVGNFPTATTLGEIDAEKNPNGSFKIKAWRKDFGDATVRVSSAEFNAKTPSIHTSHRHHHVDVYADPAVQEHLRAELLGVPLAQPILEAMFVSPTVSVEFLPVKRSFIPDELIPATITIQAEMIIPQEFVTINAELQWVQPLPTTPLQSEPSPAQSAAIQPDPKRANRFIALFNAPAEEGYYELRADIRLPDIDPIQLTEFVVVEAGTKRL